MTLQEFRDTYLGKQIEFHSYGTGAFNQCVDLVNAYINFCLDNNTKDYTEIIGTNAKDFVTNYDPEDFEFIPNTIEAIPLKGDIIVWNGRVGGGAGHVAIVLEANINTFKSLDQNWSQVERVTEETHNYTNVTGWLRPKNPPQEQDQQKLIDELRKARDENWNLYQSEKNTVTNLNAQLTSIQAESSAKDTQISSLTSQVQVLNTQVESLLNQANNASELQKQLDEYASTRTAWFAERESLNRTIGQLKRQIEESKPKGLINKLIWLFT